MHKSDINIILLHCSLYKEFYILLVETFCRLSEQFCKMGCLQIFFKIKGKIVRLQQKVVVYSENRFPKDFSGIHTWF